MDRRERNGEVLVSGAAVREARETSGATTGLLLSHVRQRGRGRRGGGGAAPCRRAFTALSSMVPSHWTSYDTRIRLFTAATEVLGDAQTMFRVGREALGSGLSPALVLVVRAMGSPRQVYRQLPRAVAKFSTTSTMRVLESGATHATLGYRLHEGYRHSRLDCQYAQGLIGMVPTIFGLPPAELVHTHCESDGHPECVYHLTWERRRRMGGRRRSEDDVPELLALREQLRMLQSAAADLVASEDVETVLQLIIERAAEAVLAPGWLLAVADPAGGPARVHSAGLPQHQADSLATALLAGADPGPNVVAVDVASARRVHGRLAAVYRPGDGGLGHERGMLGAYAGYAAAALDLLMALESSRQEADRAGRLLTLAHELAGATAAVDVCAVVAEALPPRGRLRQRCGAAVGPGRGLPAHGCLRRPRRGEPPDHGGTAMRAEEVPELVGMLTDREPRFLRPESSSPLLRSLLEALRLTDVVAVPVLAGRTFLGVATASWQAGRAPAVLAGDVLHRLRGVGDQAATALQRARLLETVQHQATHDALTGCPTGCSSSNGSARRWPPPPPTSTSACCSATSTASRRSTTRSATPPATSCCARWPPGCGPRSARATWWAAQRRRVRRPAARPRPAGGRRPRGRPGAGLLRRALPPGGHRRRRRHQRGRRRPRRRRRGQRRRAAARVRRRHVPAQARRPRRSGRRRYLTSAAGRATAGVSSRITGPAGPAVHEEPRRCRAAGPPAGSCELASGGGRGSSL
jgi:hypothetical protein